MGIDLGTTFSCVALWKNGKAEVVRNESGNRTTPSYVAFTKNEILIGEKAQEQAEMNPENTIYDVKRLIGQTYNAKDIASFDFPFTVIEKHNKPAIVVESFGKVETFWPEEISAMLLRKLKKDVEDLVKAPVNKAIITVPAHFNFLQREATKNAGILAGLDVLYIMSEPNAAALAYGISGETKDYRHILVFDLGGGTFDVSILAIGDHVLEVVKTGGNMRLGGEDFVKQLMNLCLVDIKKSTPNANLLQTDLESMQRLRIACEKAKKDLSSSPETQIVLNYLFEVKRFQKKISFAKFNELNKVRFDETLATVQEVLKLAKMNKEEIKEVVLVGGSTRIPKVRQMLAQFFTNQRVYNTIDPDEAVAVGAATRGGIKLGSLGQWLFNDVSPYSLNVRVRTSDDSINPSHRMDTLIKRNSLLPCSGTTIVRNVEDFQKSAMIRIFEGEGRDPAECNFIGQFKLKNITQAKSNTVQIEVKFDLDSDGMLKATAEDKVAGVKAEHSLAVTRIGFLTENEMGELMKRLNKYDLLAAERKQKVQMKHELESMCNDVISHIENEPNGNVTHKAINKECDQIKEWLETDEECMQASGEYIKRFRTLKNRLSTSSAKFAKVCEERGFDWICRKCKHYNFANLKKCKGCKAPK